MGSWHVWGEDLNHYAIALGSWNVCLRKSLWGRGDDHSNKMCLSIIVLKPRLCCTWHSLHFLSMSWLLALMRLDVKELTAGWVRAQGAWGIFSLWVTELSPPHSLSPHPFTAYDFTIVSHQRVGAFLGWITCLCHSYQPQEELVWIRKWISDEFLTPFGSFTS